MAHGHARQEDTPPDAPLLDVPLIVIISTVFVLLVLVSVVGAQAYYRYEKDRINHLRVYDVPNVQIDALNREQDARITEKRPVDPNRGIETIPIEEAMKLVVERHGR